MQEAHSCMDISMLEVGLDVLKRKTEGKNHCGHVVPGHCVWITVRWALVTS